MPTLKQYQERLAPFDIYNQTKVDLYTYSGLFLLRGYERIVIGKRGPYVECKSSQIKMNVIEVPENQHWRFYNKNAFYLEYRTNDEAYVKLYKQLKEVDYADYQIGIGIFLLLICGILKNQKTYLTWIEKVSNL